MFLRESAWIPLILRENPLVFTNIAPRFHQHRLRCVVRAMLVICPHQRYAVERGQIEPLTAFVVLIDAATLPRARSFQQVAALDRRRGLPACVAPIDGAALGNR